MAKVEQRQGRRPTIRDVAERANVSISSVSRVLNGGLYTSPELRARIVRAVEHFGFEPHSAAQSLRSQASHMVGCMMSDISLPIYGEMVNAAQEELERSGYALMIGATRHQEEREVAFVSAARRRRMDGLLLFAGDAGHAEFTRALAALDIPCVTVDRDVAGSVSVRADHRQGGAELARYLINLGHRRIALLTGPASLLPSTERLAGYKRAHAEAGLTVDPGLFRPQDLGSAGAYSDVRQLLEGPNPPTAIITLGAQMLASVLDVFASHKTRYPRDISLACVGDSDLARHAYPSITALTWDLGEMGRIAANLLLNRMRRTSHTGEAQTLSVPTRLIVRQSCAEPPSRAA